MRVHGLPGAVRPRAHDPLPVLRPEVGRLLARARHHVLLRHLHGHALLRGATEGMWHLNHVTDVRVHGLSGAVRPGAHDHYQRCRFF